MAMYGPIVSLIFLSLALHGNAVNGNSAVYESGVLDEVLDVYNKLARPGNADNNNRVRVRFGLAPIRLSSLDNGVLKIHAWVTMMWRDSRLAWNITGHPNVSSINVPVNQLWTPDITLYNDAADGPTKNKVTNPTVVVSSDGSCFIVKSVKLSSFCSHASGNDGNTTCILKFGSWVYDGNRLDLQTVSSNVDLGNTIANDRLSLVSAQVTRDVRKYACCPDVYPEISYYFTIARPSSFWGLLF